LRENAVVVEDEEDCSIITIKAFNNIRTIIRRIRSASASTTQQQKKKVEGHHGTAFVGSSPSANDAGVVVRVCSF
jgi:hypothetical protein